MRSTETSEWDNLLTCAHVWHLSPDALSPGDLQRRCLSWLSSQESARHRRFRTDRLSHNYLATRALCRATFSRYTGVHPRDWAFTQNPHGKPAIAAPGEFTSLRFNLTNTEGLAGCIVTRAGEVGLDAEDTSRPIDVMGVAGQFLSPVERACLASQPGHRLTNRFFEYWVLKEAYLKALGTGLSMPPDGFTISWADDDKPAPLGDFRLELHCPTVRHVAATAAPLNAGVPLKITWLAADVLS